MKMIQNLVRTAITQWRSENACTLLFLIAACLVVNTAGAQFPGTVLAWGDNTQGQTNVPVEAQSGVTEIGRAHV